MQKGLLLISREIVTNLHSTHNTAVIINNNSSKDLGIIYDPILLFNNHIYALIKDSSKFKILGFIKMLLIF